jgi:hypothetical protein
MHVEPILQLNISFTPRATADADFSTNVMKEGASPPVSKWAEDSLQSKHGRKLVNSTSPPGNETSFQVDPISHFLMARLNSRQLGHGDLSHWEILNSQQPTEFFIYKVL